MSTKNICEVDTIAAVTDNTNAIIEEDGKLRRVNLNKKFGEKVDKPSTAKVGQVIAVKTVDANGVPTEFEAITLTTYENGNEVEY